MPRRIAVLLFGLAAAVAHAPPALAHAIPIASEPAAGATLPAGRMALLLRYNSRIDAYRSRLTLTEPDGSQRVLTIDAVTRPDVLTTGTSLLPGFLIGMFMWTYIEWASTHRLDRKAL